jgi:RNA polymerase sigma-70 factor (ECF subfamily)
MIAIKKHERGERPLVENPDGILVQQALAGNSDAFEKLVQHYSISLFNFILQIIKDYDLACDVLQEVFVKLYVCLPKLDMNQPVKGWLFQVARNRCIDELRRRRVTYFSELEMDLDEDETSPLAALTDNAPLPEEWAERHDLQLCLHKAMQALPYKYRMIVALRYASQLSFAEIGHVLGIPESTAKTYFQRAKPLLRASLAEAG